MLIISNLAVLAGVSLIFLKLNQDVRVLENFAASHLKFDRVISDFTTSLEVSAIEKVNGAEWVRRRLPGMAQCRNCEI